METTAMETTPPGARRYRRRRRRRRCRAAAKSYDDGCRGGAAAAGRAGRPWEREKGYRLAECVNPDETSSPLSPHAP